MDLSYKEVIAEEEEKIRPKEPELLVQFVSKQSARITNIFGDTLKNFSKFFAEDFFERDAIEGMIALT